MKIAFEDFVKIFELCTPRNCCHEVLFSVDDSDKYQHSWMGVSNKNDVLSFWYGLTKNGCEAYDYNSFDEMLNAPVFEGKRLNEIWDKVDILSFDSLDPQYIIPKYL